MEKIGKVVRVMIYSFFSTILFVVFPATSVYAATIGDWTINNPTQFSNLQGAVAALIDVAFLAAGLVAIIYLIIGGFKYVTSGGNAEAIEGAKATILNAIIGLIVIFIAFLLVKYILSALGVQPGILGIGGSSYQNKNFP